MPKIYSERDKENFRRQFISNGLRLFSQRGYRGVSIDDVVLSVGVSKGLFYTMFPTKEEFILHCLEYRQKLFYELAQRHMEQGELSVSQRIESLIRDYLAGGEDGLLFVRQEDLREIYGRLSEERLEGLREQQSEFYARLMQLLERDTETCSPELAGNLFMLLYVNRELVESMPFLFPRQAEQTMSCMVEMLRRTLQLV